MLALLALESDGGAVARQETCLGVLATIVGTSGTDSITGTASADVVAAGAGNDTVRGGGGNDLVCGQAGGDVLYGDAGSDRISGGTEGDLLVGNLGDDEIVGDAGADFVAYAFSPAAVRVDLAAGTAMGEGTDRLSALEFIIGSPWDDTLIGDSFVNSIYGGPGNDTLDGAGGDFDSVAFLTNRGIEANLATGRATGEGSDRLTGFEGIIGGDGNDTLIGDSRVNTFDGEGGDDTIRGAGGTDVVAYLDSAAPVSVNLAAGRATGEGLDQVSGIEAVMGSPRNDTLVGDRGPNGLLGFIGDDTIVGGAGDDHLYGGVPVSRAGQNRLQGGAGNDFLYSVPSDDTLDGGTGSQDRAIYELADAAIVADLATGRATGDGRDRLVGVEGLVGSERGDTLVGNSGPNLLSGGPGNDRLSGGANDDFVVGGDGTDTSNAGSGEDYCLDSQAGQSCEITGLPGPRPVAAFAGRVLSALGRRAASLTNEELGRPSCRPARARSRALRGLEVAGAKPRRRAKHGTGIAPPPRVPPRPSRPPRTLAALLASRQLAPVASWRPTLFRYDGRRRRWVKHKQFPALTATIDLTFGGAASWRDARGRTVKEVRALVGKGRFAWAAELRQGSQRSFDWAEPHQTPGAKALFGKFCTFTR